MPFTDAQFEKLLGAIGALKSSGVPWVTVIPVFVSSLLGFGLAVVLEYFKSYLEKRKAALEKRKRELTEINTAMVAVASNLEILIHFVFQNILPHYDDSHAALKTLKGVISNDAEITKFVQSLGSYPHMMMTAPELGFLEHDFFPNFRLSQKRHLKP